jgi:hypothetical protein
MSGDLLMYNYIDEKQIATMEIDKILKTFNELEPIKTDEKIGNPFKQIETIKKLLRGKEEISRGLENSELVRGLRDAVMLNFYETPQILSNVIFNNVQSELNYFNDKKKYKVLEPSNGLCSLLEPFIRYQITNNIKIFDINTCEVNRHFVQLYKKDDTYKKYINKTYTNGFFEDNLPKDYDIIISNPPFRGPYNGKITSTLYLNFLYHSLFLLKKGGVYIGILPNSTRFWSKTDLELKPGGDDYKRYQNTGTTFTFMDKFEFELITIGQFAFKTLSKTKPMTKVSVCVIKYVND